MPAPIIIDLPEYRALSGYTSTQVPDTVLLPIINETNDAIARFIRQPLDSKTYTQYYNAPPSPRIPLRQWPVTAVTTVKVAYFSGGDPTAFDANTVWNQYTDWVLEVDDSDESSRQGVLRSLRGYWGYQFRYPPGRLAYDMSPDWKAVQVVYTAGYEQIPQSLKSAALLIVGRLYLMRRGLLPASASLNGGSYSYQSFNTAMGMLNDPTVQDYLRPFQDVFLGSM